jgi:uncharacterized protein YuzE
LHLGREGQENEAVELSPWVNIELDDKGKLIGVELFKASPAPKFYLNSNTMCDTIRYIS